MERYFKGFTFPSDIVEFLGEPYFEVFKKKMTGLVQALEEMLSVVGQLVPVAPQAAGLGGRRRS